MQEDRRKAQAHFKTLTVSPLEEVEVTGTNKDVLLS